MVVAVLAALVAFLQLPGPATCPNLSWRWVALALEALDADPPAELTDETVADAAAVVPLRAVAAHHPGHAGVVPTEAPLHARPQAVVDSGVTRAPPAA
jgi:hypothetical protein